MTAPTDPNDAIVTVKRRGGEKEVRAELCTGTATGLRIRWGKGMDELAYDLTLPPPVDIGTPVALDTQTKDDVRTLIEFVRITNKGVYPAMAVARLSKMVDGAAS